MTKLSGGTLQRLNVALAMVSDPELLILDEPFSGLDPVAVDVMSQVLLERAAAGVPTLFSSHQLDVVERDGRSVLLSRFDALGELQPAPDERGEFFLELRVSPAVPHRARGGLDEVRVILHDSIMPCVRH